MNEAIWVEDVNKDFFISIDDWGDLGCTLLPEKTEKLDRENPVNVKCIDFAKFINSFMDDDYLVLKLDIEGAEFDLILNTPEETLGKIKTLVLEFDKSFDGRFGKMIEKLSKQFGIDILGSPERGGYIYANRY